MLPVGKILYSPESPCSFNNTDKWLINNKPTSVGQLYKHLRTPGY